MDQELVVKLPAGMDYDSGALVEPVAVGAHAVGRLGSVEGKKVLVLGAGPIGNLAAQVAGGLGAASVAVSDLSDFRLEVATACGISHTVNPASRDLASAVREAFGPDEADVILECVGVEETVGQAVSLARKGTDIVIVGVFGERPDFEPDLPPRVMPSGPEGQGTFGASYVHLKYYPEWDALWPVSADPDIVVQFDDTPVRTVFWRGTRYSPAWVMENGMWMADQSIDNFNVVWVRLNSEQPVTLDLTPAE